MINALLTGLFQLVFDVLQFLANLLLLPITTFINAIFPDFTGYLNMAENFITDYILNAIATGREIFLNITGFPQELITISVNITLIAITYIGTIRVVTFVKNTWRTFKGG